MVAEVLSAFGLFNLNIIALNFYLSYSPGFKNVLPSAFMKKMFLRLKCMEKLLPDLQ